jgi:hypothetical protein
MINIAMSANANDVLYKYLQTPDQIRVNGQWTFPFRGAARQSMGANCFRSTIAVQNFPEASNGRVNRRKRTNTFGTGGHEGGNRGGRLEMNLGADGTYR